MFAPQDPSAGSRWIHRGLLAFVLLTCLRVWLGPVPMLQTAYGQIPDAGLQRKQILDEARLTNQLLSDIKHTLEAGTLHVRLEGADNPADRGAPRRSNP